MKSESSNKIRVQGDNFLLLENDVWERTLESYLMENSYLKTKLSKAVDAATEKSFLDFAEQYHAVFLRNDEVCKKLLEEVKQQKASLKKKKLTLNSTNEINFEKRQNSIRSAMENLESELAVRNKTFNEIIAGEF